MADPRTIVGTRVQAKACHVTNLAECSRRYGANASTFMVNGVVVSSITTKTVKGNRSQTMIEIDFDFGAGTIKRKSLNKRSVSLYLGPEPTATSTTIEPFSERQEAPTSVIENSNLENQGDTGFGETTINMTDSINNTAIIEATHPTNSSTDTGANINLIPTTTGAMIASPNGHNWYHEPILINNEVGGPWPYRQWGVRLPTGDVLNAGGNWDLRYSRLDIFLLMFPPAQLDLCVTCTNEQLILKNKKQTTKKELLKFFGIIILASRYEFTTRASLWSDNPPSKYEQAASFGRTGMWRKRFDDLWSNVRFSRQPMERPPNVSSEKFRWMLVDDFVSNFNQHRATTFLPSDVICVDESISRWYGQGGEWINHGLPMYVAIDRKPDNGCEIQDAACGQSGIMIQLKLVKTSKEEAALQQEHAAGKEQEDLLHGTKVLIELIKPWIGSNRCVCADSYFASVGGALELLKHRFRFIGPVKTATRKFPLQYLNSLVLHERGD
jgi:Transposase IS4